MTMPTEDPFRHGGTHLNMFYLISLVWYLFYISIIIYAYLDFGYISIVYKTFFDTEL